MDLGPHWEFIAAAYAFTGLVVFGLIAGAVLDWRAQRRALDAFESRGVRRRAEASSAGVAGTERA